jgi:TPR repeat protein/uncharacterized protein YgiM (DUF1202 family)
MKFWRSFRTHALATTVVVAALVALAEPVTAQNYDAGRAAYGRGDYATALREWLPLAEYGNADAQNYIGLMYDLGQGVSQDRTEAARWHRKAAEQGDAVGQVSLGRMYEIGRGVAQDYGEAVKWYRKAADQGNAYAQAYLGEKYQNGRGVAQDHGEAAKWYRRAAEQGHAGAQAKLGRMYQYGSGVAQVDAEAVRWYRKAANQGNAFAQVKLGTMYQNGRGVAQDDGKALKWVRKAAEQGHAYAQAHLGWIYENGRGIAQDYGEAVQWYRKAAEQGETLGQRWLGRMYTLGLGVAQNDGEAVKWYSKAAEQGNATAQADLGWMYQNGLGVPQDYGEALKWYRESAYQGYATAQNNLGLMYQKGLGVAQDYGEALEWYRMSENQGYATAQSNLGFMYKNGLGVAQDYGEALKWYRKAANQGHEDAKKALADLEIAVADGSRNGPVKELTKVEETAERMISPTLSIGSRNVCSFATTYRNDLMGWNLDPNFEKYRTEAKRLGLTLDDCGRLLGYTGQPSTMAASASNQKVKSTASNLSTPNTNSKLNIRIEPTDEPMIAAKNANVRDRPGTDGAKVAYLQRGDEVTVVGRVRGLNWVEVARGGERLGFVFTPLLAERLATRTQAASSSSTAPADSAKSASINKHAVAVILGNRDYGNPVPDVDYAANDADAMRRFVIDQLGYRDGNIIDLRDASQAEMNSVFGRENDHHGKLWRLVRPGKSDVTVFYSGHGVPGIRDKKGYLLPVDADPDTVELNGYPLDWLLNNLAKIRARSMTVYLDACFSGESPKGMLIQAVSGLSIEPRMPTTNTGMTVITAATGDQVASWDKQAKHGLFTKHLLDALAGAADKGDYGNGDGKVTVGEVKRYLDDEMTYAAQRNYGRVQTATIKGDADTVLAVIH